VDFLWVFLETTNVFRVVSAMIYCVLLGVFHYLREVVFVIRFLSKLVCAWLFASNGLGHGVTCYSKVAISLSSELNLLRNS
jgi:hypothetical protein